MLTSGSAIFLLVPDGTSRRILHPGRVIIAGAEKFEAGFEETIWPEVGSQVTAYADVRGKFMQQGAMVTEIRKSGESPIFCFNRVGQIVSAESRQTYRVSVVVAGLVAQIDGAKDCKLVDVSPTGFGAIVKRDYQIGSTIFVALNHEGREVRTTARVQTVKALPGGKFRCGFLPTEQNGPATRILSQISLAAQRAQLRRMSGAA